MKKYPILLCLLLVLTSSTYSQQLLMPYRLHTKWGYADMTGKLMIPAQYDRASRYFEKCAIVIQKGKYALIDSTGKQLLPPCDRIVPSNWRGKTWFRLKTGEKYGLADPTGKLVLPMKYDEVSVGTSHQSYAAAVSGNEYVKVTLDGEVQAATKADWEKVERVTMESVEGEPYNDFVQPFTQNNKKGYLVRGKGTKYDSIPAIYEAFDNVNLYYNVMRAKKDGLWGVIDAKHNILFPFLYKEMGVSASPKFNLYTGMRNGKYGILKPNGDILVPFEWDKIEFSNDDFWCMAYKGEKIGIIIFDGSAPAFIAAKYTKVIDSGVDVFEYRGKKIRFFTVETEPGNGGYLREDGVEYFKDK